MNIKKLFLSFYAASIAVLFLAVTPAFAEVIGNFTFIDGRVDILKQGQNVALPVETGAPVSLMDMIRTKSGSRAEITLTDGTVLRLAQGSRVEITSFIFDENGALKEGTLNLLRGKMRVINFKAVPAFQVLTPNAKADNITGTDFYFIYEKGSTWFYGNGGTLLATGTTDPSRAIPVKQRNCVRVADNGIPVQDAFNDIDIKKYEWDTAANENVPVVAQLPSEGEVYTYTPLGGRAIDTPSMPVEVASDDLTCTQCPMEGIPLVATIQPSPATIKMGNFERTDTGCCEPVPPIAPPVEY